MADHSQPNDPIVNDPDDHLSRLLCADIEDPWYKTFVRNVKEFFNPPKLPPLVLTSKPIPVKDIWGLYGRKKQSFMMSTGFQIGIVLVVFILASNKQVQVAVQKTVLTYIADTAPPEVKMKPQPQTSQGGGGGGDRSPLPASFGKLPKFALKQFTPPVAVYNNMNPKLAMEPTLIGDPNTQVANVDSPLYGDPLSKYMTPSNGQGSGGGIGNGKGGGVGNGDGGGYGPGSGGGVGGNVFRVGGGVSAPVLLSKTEPEYSEEARKAKHQGTVMLYVQIDPSGHATNIKVVKSLGLGLDEKAMEAVQKWKFSPGKKDGKPVTVEATIEVNFRLL
jgi:periplasmic protein TonB